MESAADFFEVGFVRFSFFLQNFIVWHMDCFVVTVIEEIMFWKPVQAHQAPIVVPLYFVDDVVPARHLFPVLILFLLEILVCIIIWNSVILLSTQNPFPIIFNILAKIS